MLMHQDVTDTTPWGPADEPALVCAEACFDQAFHYWRGASGRITMPFYSATSPTTRAFCSPPATVILS